MRPSENGFDASVLRRIVGIAVGIVIIGIWLLWIAPPPVLKHVTEVAGAIAPVLTFITVLLAVVGWWATARLNGDEARRTEAAKRAASDSAHRDHLRARFVRVWLVIEEAVGVKPYIPDLVEQFVAEAEELYWNVGTFAAFTVNEQTAIQQALDRCRFDNRMALAGIKDDGTGQPARHPHDVPKLWFVSSLETLESVFRDVFRDAELAATISRQLARTRADVDRIRAIEARQQPY